MALSVTMCNMACEKCLICEIYRRGLHNHHAGISSLEIQDIDPEEGDLPSLLLSRSRKLRRSHLRLPKGLEPRLWVDSACMSGRVFGPSFTYDRLIRSG